LSSHPTPAKPYREVVAATVAAGRRRPLASFPAAPPFFVAAWISRAKPLAHWQAAVAVASRPALCLPTDILIFLAMVMAACWRRILASAGGAAPAHPHFFSTRSPYFVKVGIPEFLHGVGKGVETHVAKLETEIGDLNKLLVTRTLRLKKLGIPCKHRKLILSFAHKYRLGLWRPRADAVKI
ncbi:hypothetical protein Taro_048794, partial [Colocasia esculenta]|nr:hypothetical protein [Colocasia esculenta]